VGDRDPSVDPTTPEHLTEVLRRAGVADGRVSGVIVESSRDTITATVVRLRLDYAGDGRGPASLFLKRARAGVTGDFAAPGPREVDFYARVAAAMPDPIAPRCFEAVCDPAAGARHLLLEDLADSHVTVTDWPVAPTAEQCEHIVDAYARFHGFWWDDPRLGRSVGVLVDDATFDRWLGDFAKRYAAFADRMGDRLSAARRDVYERLIRETPRLLARYRSHRHLTVVHGDAHVWNLMYPRDPSRHRVRLVDWDGWRIDMATDDLAYMMALHWYPERRSRFERALLERYHTGLLAQGVAGYDVDALWADYRLSVVFLLATPVWQASVDLPPRIWWSHLERIMMAFEDLGGRDLLD
jgi:hypothetical protein